MEKKHKRCAKKFSEEDKARMMEMMRTRHPTTSCKKEFFVPCVIFRQKHSHGSSRNLPHTEVRLRIWRPNSNAVQCVPHAPPNNISLPQGNNPIVNLFFIFIFNET